MFTLFCMKKLGIRWILWLNQSIPPAKSRKTYKSGTRAVTVRNRELLDFNFGYKKRILEEDIMENIIEIVMKCLQYLNELFYVFWFYSFYGNIFKMISNKLDIIGMDIDIIIIFVPNSICFKNFCFSFFVLNQTFFSLLPICLPAFRLTLLFPLFLLQL